MRTLQEITDRARRNEPLTVNELRYAVCAYDVLLAQMDLPKNYQDLKLFMVAADIDPKEYIGIANDFIFPDVREWHKTMINIEQKIKELDSE